MTGFINSKTQLDILQFLERVGPCPGPTLAVKFGKKTPNHLAVLRRAGYIYDLFLSDTVFWMLQGYGRFDPAYQKALSALVVDVEAKGGTYDNNVVILDNQQYVMRWEDNNLKLLGEPGVCQNNEAVPDVKDMFSRMIEIRKLLRQEVDPGEILRLEEEFAKIRKALK